MYKKREERLWLFGHSLRREESVVVRLIMKMNVEGKKETRGRWEKMWLNVNKNSM